MFSHRSSGEPGERADLACDWSITGVGAASVHTVGTLSEATAPLAEQVLDEALEHARLVAVDVRRLSVVDRSGLQVLLDASHRAGERGSRMVLIGASVDLQRLVDSSATRSVVDLLPGARPLAAKHRTLPRSPEPPIALARSEPANPVNAQVIPVRAMDIPGRVLWTHGSGGTVRPAWAPASGTRLPAGARVELYLGHQGTINGWWHRESGAAINQRRVTRIIAESDTAASLACQGACELVWQAPAAAELLEHGERCLTCAGALVLA